MNRDTLSDLLRNVRVRGAAFSYLRCRDVWSTVAHPLATGRAVIPDAATVMGCYMIAKGSAWAEVAGSPPVKLETGDVVLFPRGDAHVLSSAPGLRRDHVAAFAQGSADTADTVIVCGFLGCDRQPANPLALALPSMLHVAAARAGGWLERAMEEAVAESHLHRAGGSAVLERLAEMMFVDVVRRYLDPPPTGHAGWLAGLHDACIGRALAAMHADPSAPWTLAKLGRAAGISRTVLHERFVQLLGCAPMHYLTQLRMHVASNLLQTGKDKLAVIALAVGYRSEASFNRAFKRATGRPAATWRRERLAG